MASNCRHVMPSGRECHGYALKGGPFCYFHTRLHQAERKPAGVDDSIEIPMLEERCAIQVTITQVLRAIVNNTIDRPRASLLLYGLQLALQSVDRINWAIPCGTIEAISQTPDGDELVADPDEDEDEDDEEEEEEDSDSDESGDDSDAEDDNEDDEEEEDSDSDESGDDEDTGADGGNGGEGDVADDSDQDESEEADDGEVESEDAADEGSEEDSEEDDDDDGLETTEDFLAAVKYLNSIKRQAGLDPDY